MSVTKLGKLPTSFACPQCKMLLPAAMSMMGHDKPRISKGMVIICSACAGVNVLGDSDLHPMSPMEFKALSEASKRAVMVARHGVASRIKDGGSWNPYGKN